MCVIDKLLEIDSSRLEDIFQALFATYPRYQDRSSRRAVRRCFEASLRNEVISSQASALIVDFVLSESRVAIPAPANSFVLLEWCVLLQIEASRHELLSSAAFGKVIIAAASSLEKCGRSTTRSNLRRSAWKLAARGLREIIGKEDNYKERLSSIVSCLVDGQNSATANLPYVGVVIDVYAKLSVPKIKIHDQIRRILSFYAEAVIGAKKVVPTHIANGIHQLLASYVDAGELDLLVRPMEKAILRSPEAVLNGLIPIILQHLPNELDLSDALYRCLLQPLLSSLKSTNPTVRQGAIAAFDALRCRSQNATTLVKISDDVVTALKSSKTTTPEARASQLQLLGALPAIPEVSNVVVHAIATAAAKEANEATLVFAVGALCKHISTLLGTTTSVEKSILDIVIKGCRDKRPLVRRAWYSNLGEAIRSNTLAFTKDHSLDTFSKALFQELDEAFREASSNAPLSLQNGLIPGALVLVSLVCDETQGMKTYSSFSKEGIISSCLAMSPKLSFMLNHKILARLGLHNEMEWAVRALVSLVPSLHAADSAAQTAWAQSLTYFVVATDVPISVRRYTMHLVHRQYMMHRAVVADNLILGLWDWLQKLHSKDKESWPGVSKAGPGRLRAMLACINSSGNTRAPLHPCVPSNVIKDQLIPSLVLCQAELVPRANWIDTCIKLGVDPGQLVEERAAELMDHLLQRCQVGILTENENICKAAVHAAADLVFVKPQNILPLMINQIDNDLDPAQLHDLASQNLPTSPSSVSVQGSTSNLVMKHSLRNSSHHQRHAGKDDSKSGTARGKEQGKNSAKIDQEKLDEFIADESVQRQAMENLRIKLRRGALLVEALIEAPHTDAATWMSACTDRLLKAMQAGAGSWTGDKLALTYLALSNKISARLGSLRKFVGVTTLRATENVPLAPEYESEPLEALTLRVLYRLRLAAEQRPFESATLSYTLPLIFAVIQQGSLGNVAEASEDTGTQTLLALEFLASHMGLCDDLFLPRDRILGHLISAMKQHSQHYRLIKDAINALFESMSHNLQSIEIEVLLQGVTDPDAPVRLALLQATAHAELDLTDLGTSKELWLVCHDSDEDVADTADTVWKENDLKNEASLVPATIEYLGNHDSRLRSSAARALATAISAHGETLPGTLARLKEIYLQAALPIAPKRDKYGMPIKQDMTDQWQLRSGISKAFQEMVPIFPPDCLVAFIQFLVSEGPLADSNEAVRGDMLNAGVSLVAARGSECLESLMELLQRALASSDNKTQQSDWTHEGAVVLYGSLARHLQEGDTRTQTVVAQLLESLHTPSEPVQLAVCECLPPLVRLIKSEDTAHVKLLMEQLLQNKQYASRRGAAYGLAGWVKGRGVLCLRQHRILNTLSNAIQNKKSVEHREGAMFAYEIFSFVLGRLFEPYIIEILPDLLLCFGDPNPAVRDACLDAAKTCFASLSSFGVKKVLPRLLDGLEDSQWRSKKGACDLLGAMAYLDPQQLAISLPEIIPPLASVLNDSHKEVRLSGKRSLHRFGEVISNPEVKSLVDILLKALSDPTKHTEDALNGLIRVSFVHYLDAPSLALIIRILERGLGDRSSTKRKSAQIIGSLAHLTERKDLVSHLPVLVTGLRAAAVDPVPATRATASKALGSLVEKLGEDALPDLIPSLMTSLKTDTGAGDRLGSAQALSEVLAGLGTTRLEETLPSILQNVASAKAPVREGFMTLFIFLPACFGNSFASYLSRIVPSILAGLADELESIRDVALRAGRLLVKNFSTKAIDLLLPELQGGLADDNHRIRLSSVELVGDLLFNLTGIANKSDAEEDDGEGATQAGNSLLEVLGEDRRNRVLSSLYICRCDTFGLVRSAAVAVWKALVATPRTLKELVPTLTQMIIGRLASPNLETRTIAGNALGELIRKAGEGILATLLPSLEAGLQSSADTDRRQGICIALQEIISSASPEALHEYEAALVSILRTSIVDPDAEVREAAAEAFDAFQKVFGKKAVDQILPYLLSLLREPAQADHALSALLTLLTDTSRANMILPNLIPTLLSPPITSFNARALSSLASIRSASINRRLPAILNSLADGITSDKVDSELKEELNLAFGAVLCSVDMFEGLTTAMGVVLAMIKHDDHGRRALAASQLAEFFSSSSVDFSRYNPALIRALLTSFDDRDEEVVAAAWKALSQMVTRLRKEEMESLAISTCQVLQQTGVAGTTLAGFALSKGILPVLQIFLQGLMNGTVEQRTRAAVGISEIVDRSSPDSLKPYVTQMTGPLIRVVSERSVEVKCAILQTLSQLLEKIPTFLKPFLPQLQRTFTKSLADPSSEELRTRATRALSTLIALTPRVDPLIAELVAGAKTTDAGVRSTMVRALQEVVSRVGSSMSEASKDSILGLIDSIQDNRHDKLLIANSRLLGGLVRVLPNDRAVALIKSRVLISSISEISILALNAVIVERPGIMIHDFFSVLSAAITTGLGHRDFSIQQGSILALGKVLLAEGGVVLSRDEQQQRQQQQQQQQQHEKGTNSIQLMIASLTNILLQQPPADIDSRRLSLVVIRTTARHHPSYMQNHLPILAPAVFAAVRDSVIPIKLAAEAAFLEVFSVVDREAEVFDRYMQQQQQQQSDSQGRSLSTGQQRNMQEYFKRVALRLAGQARERRDADGGALGLAADEREDELEVWSVGGRMRDEAGMNLDVEEHRRLFL